MTAQKASVKLDRHDLEVIRDDLAALDVANGLFAGALQINNVKYRVAWNDVEGVHEIHITP